MNRWRPLKSRTSSDTERTDRDLVRQRANGRCEVAIGPARCTRQDQETHHVIKRSHGGKLLGSDYLLRVCRVCHSLMDAATTQRTTLPGGLVIHGKLCVVAMGNGMFRCWFETDSRLANA